MCNSFSNTSLVIGSAAVPDVAASGRVAVIWNRYFQLLVLRPYVLLLSDLASILQGVLVYNGEVLPWPLAFHLAMSTQGPRVLDLRGFVVSFFNGNVFRGVPCRNIPRILEI